MTTGLTLLRDSRVAISVAFTLSELGNFGQL